MYKIVLHNPIAFVGTIHSFWCKKKGHNVLLNTTRTMSSHSD